MGKKKIKVRKQNDEGKTVIEEIEIDEVEPGEEEETDDEDQESDDEGDDIDVSDAEKTKAEIKRLRKENAKSRLRNKELAGRVNSFESQFGGLKKALGVGADDELTPEEIAQERQQLAAERDALLMDRHLRDLQDELGIPKEHGKYFRFLLNEKSEDLAEGEELSQEDFDDIVKQIKALGGSKSGKNSSGVNSDGAPAPKEGKGTITVEEFAAMNLGERSSLYVKNQREYERLFAQANAKGLL